VVDAGHVEVEVQCTGAVPGSRDPAAGDADTSRWNRRLVYEYGGGCGSSRTRIAV
jgi:hypothetical protein